MMRNNLTIAVSTMYARGVVSRFLKRPYLIVDQGDSPFLFENQMFDYHFSTDRGISKSRNVALKFCKTEYLLFADDDVFHIDEGVNKIESYFEETKADVITFVTMTPTGEFFKKYKSSPFAHSKLSLFRVNSVEIAVRVNAIRSAGLCFDSDFGLGSQFPTGEEIIFVQDALRAGLNVQFVPEPIVIHPKESSGSRLSGNGVLIRAKGAMFARIYGNFSYFFSFVFSVKHYRKSGFGFFKCLSLIFSGCSTYLNNSIHADTKK